MAARASRGRSADVHIPRTPNLQCIGGRMRAERESLELSVWDASQLTGLSEKTLSDITARGQFASALRLLAMAGYDVLFIVTGIWNRIGEAEDRTAGDSVRHALEQLPGNERTRLILHLASEELRYWMDRA